MSLIRLILAALALAAAALSAQPQQPEFRLLSDGSGWLVGSGEPFCIDHMAARCDPPTELQPSDAVAVFVRSFEQKASK